MLRRRTVFALGLALTLLHVRSARALDWQRIAASGDAAPPAAALGSISAFDSIQVHDDGSVLFLAQVGSSRPLLRWKPGVGLETVLPAATTSVAGSLPPISVESFGGSSVDGFAYAVRDAGGVAVVADVRVEGCAGAPWYRSALLSGSPGGALDLLLQPGTPVPALGPGWILAGKIGDRSAFPGEAGGVPHTSPDGGVAFVGTALELAHPCSYSPDAASWSGVFARDGAGEIALVAGFGQPAPGVEDSIFARFFSVMRNQAGEIAFGARLQPTMAGPNRTAAYRWTPAAGLELVAAAGIELPGGLLLDSALPVLLDEYGSMLIVSEGEAGGIYRADPTGDLTPLYETGQPAVGLPGEEWTMFWDSSVLSSPLGALAFEADIAPPFGAEVVRGIWGEDAAGVPTLRAVEGAVFPDSTSVIDGVLLVGVGDDGRVLSKVNASEPYWAPPSLALVLSHPSGSDQVLLRSGDLLDFGTPGPIALERFAEPFADRGLRHVVVDAWDSASGTSALFYAPLPMPESSAAEGIAVLVVADAARRRARRRLRA